MQEKSKDIVNPVKEAVRRNTSGAGDTSAPEINRQGSDVCRLVGVNHFEFYVFKEIVVVHINLSFKIEFAFFQT
jgi:hypothetical protein